MRTGNRLRHLGLFEDFKSKNITVDDVVKCIDAGGVVYATVVSGLPGNDPEMPMLPVSVDESGLVTVFVDGTYHEVELRNIDRIEWSGGKGARLDESLNVSPDLSTVLSELADSGDKVAGFLETLFSSEAYPDDEDVNCLELSNEMNKFSFMPKKRRSFDMRANYDRDSMPTRIGKIVRKIYKTVEDKLTFKHKGDLDLNVIGDSSSQNVLRDYGIRGMRMPEEGTTRYEIILKDILFLSVGSASMKLSVDGEEVEASFFSIEYDYRYTRDGYKRIDKIVFDSPTPIESGNYKIKVELKSEFSISDKDLEDFVNGVVAYLKANSSGDETAMEIVNGEDIRFWYNSKNYQTTKGELGNSCMSHPECQDYLDIYCENPDRVSLVILKSKDNKLIGRALLWGLDNGRKLMDRVYSILNSDARVFIDHARKNGWIYKLGRHRIMDDKKEYTKELTVTLQNHEFRYYPYLDTLKYLSSDGRLSDVGDSDDKYLNSTDGDYSYDEEEH